jgi:hypothetical protein
MFQVPDTQHSPDDRFHTDFDASEGNMFPINAVANNIEMQTRHDPTITKGETDVRVIDEISWYACYWLYILEDERLE